MADITPQRFEVNPGNTWQSIFSYAIPIGNGMVEGDAVMITNYSASTMLVMVSDTQPQDANLQKYAAITLYQGQTYIAEEGVPNLFIATPTGPCDVAVQYVP